MVRDESRQAGEEIRELEKDTETLERKSGMSQRNRDSGQTLSGRDRDTEERNTGKGRDLGRDSETRKEQK